MFYLIHIKCFGPDGSHGTLCVGDRPEDVKARLKYWAQAVACTVRLCN
ncbi:hypothetical protein HanPI659440_Chr14g0547511 [Helianthus annuus]|nr:hypothetical protein HanPI659440_Chr14g0547511 [Helianthus annuus]